jgi:hypothetical protein
MDTSSLLSGEPGSLQQEGSRFDVDILEEKVEEEKKEPRHPTTQYMCTVPCRTLYCSLA